MGMKNGDYIEKIDGAERRHKVGKVEARAEGDAEYFDGHAANIGEIADLGWFTEEIMPGAFDDVLGDDVRGLFNHDPDQILGRTKANTMVLSVDEKGLRYSIRYNPNDPDHVRVMQKVKRGDVSQSSFSFDVKDAKWSTRNGKDHRQIFKFQALYDVAPVTYPAYENTTVAARSLEKVKQGAGEYTKDLAEMDLDFMRRDLKIKTDNKK